MTTNQILEQIKQLTPTERLVIIERAVQMLRDDLPDGAAARRARLRGRLAEAAVEALPVYTADSELTIFTALDGEDFYDYETK